MKHLITALLLSGSIALQGCSVMMAASGSDNPDIGAVRQDATRGEVELHLGKPVSATTLANGHIINVYEYEIGNEPSAGRAIGHGVMDVLTLGVWEIIGTPVEGFQGDKRSIQVEYNVNDVVVAVRSNNTGE